MRACLALVWVLMVGCDRPSDPVLVFPDPVEGLMSDLDQDGSGTVTLLELDGSLVTPVHFSAMDQDGNQLLTIEELRFLLSTYDVLAPPPAGPGKRGKRGKGPPSKSTR